MGGDWRLGLLGVYVLACAVLLFSLGTPDDLLEFFFQVFILLLMIAPVARLCVWPGQAIAKGGAAIIIGVWGLWQIIDAMFFQPPDAQSALVLLFVPVLQLIAVGGFAILLAMWRVLSRASDD